MHVVKKYVYGIDCYVRLKSSKGATITKQDFHQNEQFCRV